MAHQDPQGYRLEEDITRVMLCKINRKNRSLTRLLHFWAICLEDQILPLDSRPEVTLILVRCYREGWSGCVQENEQEAKEGDEEQTSPGLTFILLEVRDGTSLAYDFDSSDYLPTVWVG